MAVNIVAKFVIIGWIGGMGMARRVAPGLLDESALSAEPSRWPALGAMTWDARRPLPAGYEWQAGASNAESSDPRTRAMTDLAHVLLNSNEFLHLH